MPVETETSTNVRYTNRGTLTEGKTIKILINQNEIVSYTIPQGKELQAVLKIRGILKDK